MEVFSRYEEIQTYSGEIVSTIIYLDFIRNISTDFIVKRLLKETAKTIIDKASQFYLTYRWTYLTKSVEFDDGRKLANACGIAIEDYWDKSGFVKKSGSKISVLGPKDRPKI